MSGKSSRTLLISFFLTFSLLLSNSALGKVTLSTAADANISADNVDGAYTVITGPTLTEGSGDDIGRGTIVLNAPGGFAFDPAATVTVSVSRVNGSGIPLTLDSDTATVTATTITIRVTATDLGGGTKSEITWSGIAVRPTAGTPLAGGDILVSGTSSLKGFAAGDSVGTLTEVPGAATQLVFSVQPAGAVAGAPFGTQPVVVARDQFGNNSSSGLPATLNAQVSLTAGTGPLQGTTALNIGTSGGRGTAAFTDLRIDAAGAGKQLTATAGSLTSAQSTVFSVSPGPANRLIIATQPSTTVQAGVPFAQQPAVLIEDAYGNVRSNDTLVVTAARHAGSGTLLGTTSLAAVHGVASYTDLAHPVATTISLIFSSGDLASAISEAITISPGPFSKLSVLLPGESPAPGTLTGKSGSAFPHTPGSSFTVSVNSVDAYWNLAAANDTLELRCSDPLAVLPEIVTLSGGSATFSVVANTIGPQTITVSDTTRPEIPSASSSLFYVGEVGPMLPAQADHTLDELTTLVVTNTAIEIGGPTNLPPELATNTIVFNYTSRTALMADGWSFVATLPGGIPRNTEITDPADGALVDYSQTSHPGVLRIPCDLGDEWGSANSARNMLFRSLPPDWLSMRLAIGFDPTMDYQQAHLMLYQDDDNFIQSGVAFNGGLGGEVTTLVWEVGGSVNHFVTPLTNVAGIRLRLDRDPNTGDLTGYYSLNGTIWQAFGTINIGLSNPRVGIWVGGSLVPWTDGLASCDLQRLDVISSNVPVSGLTYQLVDAPAGASIDSNGIITWKPSEDQGPGTNVITTIVRDSNEPPVSATNQFQVAVDELNSRPVLPGIPNQSIVGQTPLAIVNTASDPDIPANSLTYQLLAAPPNAVIDENGVISWTPSAVQVPSTNIFTTKVTDFNPWAATAQHLSATNSFTVFVFDHAGTNALALPSQPDVAVNEQSVLRVTNSVAGAGPVSQPITNSFVFNYSSRSALLSDGWSFVATLPDGSPRNTEITSSGAGALVSYDQNAHPGRLWIPCDLGDLWASLNDTRNSLFRSLPADWTSVRLALSFAPGLNFQQAHLAVYQDDDNYVEAGFAYNGSAVVAMDQETNGVAANLSTAGVSVTNLQLRLDRDLGDDSITTLYSIDGTAWSALGQTTPALVNPRLCIWVGGSPVAYTNGMPICSLQRLDIISSNSNPVLLSYHLVDPPAGATIDNSGIIRWTPTEAQGPGANQIVTIVNDNALPPSIGSNSFNVVVREVNTAPLLPDQPDQTIVGTSPLVLSNAATDPDLPANSLNYQLLLSPPNALIDQNGLITWTPSPGQVPGTNLFVTVVTDSNPWAVNAQHLSATNSFSVVVTGEPVVVPVPVTIGYQSAENVVQLAFSGDPGQTYEIQWAPEVAGPWSTLQTVQADTSGQVLFEGAGPASTAFFRVLRP